MTAPDPVPPAVPVSPRSSTGLAPRTASALAYAAGPVSGAIMLLAESTNEEVRFHAWQSILAIGGLGVLVFLGYLTAVVSLFVSATAVASIVRLSMALWIVLLLVWGFCVWKALAGERVKLPLAGDWAERLQKATGPRTS
jgi:uncharacterized membrane protein